MYTWQIPKALLARLPKMFHVQTNAKTTTVGSIVMENYQYFWWKTTDSSQLYVNGTENQGFV